MHVWPPALTSFTQLQNSRLCHVVDIEGERLRNVQKIKLARAKRVKRARLLFSIVIHVNFWRSVVAVVIESMVWNHFSFLTKTATECNTRSQLPNIFVACSRLSYSRVGTNRKGTPNASSTCFFASRFRISPLSLLFRNLEQADVLVNRFNWLLFLPGGFSSLHEDFSVSMYRLPIVANTVCQLSSALVNSFTGWFSIAKDYSVSI